MQPELRLVKYFVAVAEERNILQAVHEGLGVVVYVRSAFPPDVPGSIFVAAEPRR